MLTISALPVPSGRSATLVEWPCGKTAGTFRAGPTRPGKRRASASSTWPPKSLGAARPTAPATRRTSSTAPSWSAPWSGPAVEDEPDIPEGDVAELLDAADLIVTAAGPEIVAEIERERETQPWWKVWRRKGGRRLQLELPLVLFPSPCPPTTTRKPRNTGVRQGGGGAGRAGGIGPRPGRRGRRERHRSAAPGTLRTTPTTASSTTTRPPGGPTTGAPSSTTAAPSHPDLGRPEPRPPRPRLPRPRPPRPRLPQTSAAADLGHGRDRRHDRPGLGHDQPGLGDHVRRRSRRRPRCPTPGKGTRTSTSSWEGARQHAVGGGPPGERGQWLIAGTQFITGGAATATIWSSPDALNWSKSVLPAPAAGGRRRSRRRHQLGPT